MTAKGYSAGAIFLQVVPVFKNAQKEIEQEANNWGRTLGDDMERHGEKAGERAGRAAGRKMNASMEEELKRGVSDMEKALAGIDTSKMGDRVKREVRAMRQELEDLSKVDIKVDDNFRDVERRIAELRAHLRDIGKDARLRVELDGMVQVYRKLKELEATLNGIKNPEIKVDVDTRSAQRKMGEFERSVKASMTKAGAAIDGSVNKELEKLKAELDYLGRLRVNIDIGSGQIRREVAEIKADLRRLATEHPDIAVRLDAGRGYRELAAWEAAVMKADHQRITVKATVDSKGAERGFDNIAGRGTAAANAFRAFNIYLFAAATMGPALVPVLGAVAGGLLAIGPAAAVAGAGLGSVLVGFSGLSGALTALQNRQDQQAKTAQTAAKQNQTAANQIADAQRAVADAERNAARAAADAARRVADARRQAAEAIRNALEQQQSAQESYAQSVKDVQQAEADLRQARKDAAGTGHELKDKIKDNSLAIQQAQLDSFSATNNYNAVMADGSSTNAEKEQARIQREQALQALHELRDQQKELAKEKKKWDKDGVEGTDAVKSAEDRLVQALQQQKDAYRQLQDAARNVDKARADGARNVAAALRDQNRTLADNKRALADARRNLGRARESQDELNASITSQDQAVQAAFSKLGPAGRHFALFLFGLRKSFYRFRNDIQAAMLPSIEDAIRSLLGSKSGSAVRKLLVDLAGGFGRFVKALSRSFQGPAWLRFFRTLDKFGPGIQKAYGRAFIKVMEALASVLTVAAPYALQFAKGLAHMMERFADWAKSKKGADAIQGFMDYAKRVAPDVLDFLGALARGAVAVAKGLARWGDITLSGITAFLNGLAKMNPMALAGIVTSLFVLVSSAQSAYALMQIAISGFTLLMSTTGAIVFAVLGVGAALVYLYTTNKRFRDFVKKAWVEISAVVKKAWKKDLKPALDDLMGALTDLWQKVLVPFFTWFGPILVKFAKHYIPFMFKVLSVEIRVAAWVIRHIIIPVIVGMFNTWKKIAQGFKWVWDHILKPVWEAVKKYAIELWTKSLKPTFEDMKKGWDKFVDGLKWTWDHVLHPVWNFIKDRALPALKSAFHTTVNAIADIWDRLKESVGAPIKFVLDTVVNKGLIAGFNKVSGWVHGPTLKDVPIPDALQQYATGGIMPGYTPGRDVHSFVSPTAGRLDLSGGEAVMRPEWTAAMGAGYVNTMNAIARSQGVAGIRKAMGFATGGVMKFARGGILNPDDKVYINGMAISRIAAAQVALAKQMSGIPIYMMQGGFGGNHILASGSSHDYPGVGDFGPGSISLEKVMRQVGFAAWARNVPGRSQVGSGAHVHAVSLLDPGDASSPQVTGSWPAHKDGLGGGPGSDPAPHYSWIPGLVSKIANMGIGQITTLIGADGKGGGHPHIPSWVKGLLKDPLGAVKGWVTSASDKAGAALQSPFFDAVKKVPLVAAKAVTDKVWDAVPGWAKNAVGWAGDAAHWVVGGVKGAGHALSEGAHDVGGALSGGAHAVGGAVSNFLGLAKGGILPYNGTMMYDNGGYLPPGLTTVMNLTGKPEPVFTHDQWSGMGGGKGEGGSIHYEPHFEGSNLTPEDVAADLNFQFRRMRGRGKYAGVTP